MPDVRPQFESQDEEGLTLQFVLTNITSTPQAVPSIADKNIEEFLLVAAQNGAKKIWVSLDGGVNYIPIFSTGHLAWTLKQDASGNRIKQLYLKADDSTPLGAYLIINFEY